MIAHCPALTKGHTTDERMVLNIDIAPTILEAAGVGIPATMQGRSFLPLIQRENVDWRTEFLYEYFWERAFAQTPTVLGLRTDQYSYMRYQGVWDLYELYDIQKDPDQMNNLLGNVRLTTQAGDALRLIKDSGLREMVNTFQKKLFGIIRDTGGRIDPTWGR